jgi:hypothetical protein
MEHTKYTKISTIRKFPAIRYLAIIFSLDHKWEVDFSYNREYATVQICKRQYKIHGLLNSLFYSNGGKVF